MTLRPTSALWRRHITHPTSVIAVDIGHSGWRLDFISNPVTPIVINAVGGPEVVGAVVEVIRTVVKVVGRVIEVVQAVLEVIRAIVPVHGLLCVGVAAGNKHGHQRQGDL